MLFYLPGIWNYLSWYFRLFQDNGNIASYWIEEIRISGYLTCSYNWNPVSISVTGIRKPSMQNLAGSALFLPQGGTHFQLVPLGSPQGYFMGKFSPLTSIKFLPPMPPIQKWSKLFAPEKLMRLEKNWLSTHYYYTRPSK